MLHRINCFGQIGQRQTQDQNAEPAPKPSPPSSSVDYIIFSSAPNFDQNYWSDLSSHIYFPLGTASVSHMT